MKKIALHGIAILMALCLIISCDNSPKTKTFTVTFDSDGGTEVAAMTVEAGKTVTEPTAPKKSCWEFNKWTLDDEPFDFSAPVEKDIKLKALWDATDAVWDGKTAVTSWFDKNKNEFEITKASELAGLAKLVNEKTSDFSGKNVKLMNDLDLNNKAWDPIGNSDYNYHVNSNEYHAFKGTFDGAGHTIKNLKVDSTNKNTIADGYYASGLFGWAHANSVIQNLNLENVKLDGHHNMGAVVGYLYGGQVTECHVKNATITNTHANTDGCGDKTGALVGIWQGSDDAVMKNSTAVDCTISGCRDAGQLIGAAKPARIGTDSGCSAENVTVTENKNPQCTDEKAGNNIREELIGREF